MHIPSGGTGFLIASVLLYLTSLLPSNGVSTTYGLFLFAYFLQCGSMKFFNRGNAILTSELSSHNRGRFSNLQAAGRYCMAAAGANFYGGTFELFLNRETLNSDG